MMLRRVLPVLVFSLAALAVLVSLGLWQLERLEWKEALIAAANTRVNEAPAPLPSREAWAGLASDDFIYRPVEARGRYLAQSFYVFTTISEPKGGPYQGQGYWVLTPLALEEGGILFVNRGFIPIDMKDAFAARRPPAGLVEVAGLMKPDEPPAFFTPEPNLERSLFYSRDVHAMAEAAGAGGEAIAPFYIDALESGEGGLPQGGETLLTFPNSHLGYAITWFGLALTLIGVAGTFIYRQVRDERALRKGHARG